MKLEWAFWSVLFFLGCSSTPKTQNQSLNYFDHTRIFEEPVEDLWAATLIAFESEGLKYEGGCEDDFELCHAETPWTEISTNSSYFETRREEAPDFEGSKGQYRYRIAIEAVDLGSKLAIQVHEKIRPIGPKGEPEEELAVQAQIDTGLGRKILEMIELALSVRESE